MLSQSTLDDWIERYGPYVYHGANCRNGTPGEQVAQSILSHGIVPDHRADLKASCPQAPWKTASWSDADWEDKDHEMFGCVGYDDWWLNPRPGHAYMTIDIYGAYGEPLFQVDLRELDPVLICPDEDYLRDFELSFATFPQRRGDARLAQFGELSENSWGPAKDLNPCAMTLGQQAQAIGWGETEHETMQGGLKWGVIAYRGVISPNALTQIAMPKLAHV